MRLRTFLLCLAAQALAGRSFASNLAWEKTEIDVRAAPMDESTDAVFRFSNAGTGPITITSAIASCGCTVPKLEKQSYAPGEKGELHALFTHGDRVGPQEKAITVVTDEPGSTPQVLILKVDIPKLYDVSPYFVTWRGGEAATAKKISIRLELPDVVTPVSVESRDSRIHATLEHDARTRDLYEVMIKPESTATSLSAPLIVNLSAPSGGKRVITLYAIVRAAPAGTTPQSSSAATTAPR